MPKENVQLSDLDRAIKEKYGNVENFVENGQESNIENAINSLEEVESQLKNVQENADKDGRGDEEKKKVRESLIGFNNQKNKISPRERLERDGFTTRDPSYETKRGLHKVVKMNDGTEQHWRQKENGDYFLKKIVEGDTSTHFDELGEITQQNKKSGEVVKGSDRVERILSNNQELFNEPTNPDNYVRIRKNNTEMKLLEEDAREKFTAMNALPQGSSEREQAYEQWKSAVKKVEDYDSKKESASQFITSRDISQNNANSSESANDTVENTSPSKKIEIQSQQSSKNNESFEDAQLAEELEDNLRGKYRAQANPETYNQQSQTPMESWIEREEQSQGNQPIKNNPLARAIEEDRTVEDQQNENHSEEKKINKRSLSVEDKTIPEQGALSKEIERQENSWLSKKFKGMRERVGNLKKTLYEKNPKLGKVLGAAGEKYSQFNRWMNKGNQTQRILKRIVVSGTLGALTGGVSFGITAARVVGSAAAGAGAGLAHKWYTNKNFDRNLSRNQENLKQSYYNEIAFKQQNEFTATNPEKNTTFSIRDRKNLESLRSKREQRTLSAGEERQLSMLEATRKSVAESLLKSRREYRTYYAGLKDKLVQKNERNNQLVSAAAGLVTGFSMRFGPELWDSLTNHPNIPENVPTVTPTPEPIPTPAPEVVPSEHIVSSDAFINKGEGITHALARQINASPELQEAFGLDGPANGQELAEIAKKLGYINEDGSDVRVAMGHGAAYELRIDPKTGEPFVMEYKGGELEGNNYVGGEEVEKHMQGENFEAKARDSYEYIHNGSTESISGDSGKVNFSAREIYPDIDFDQDVNPTIPDTDELHSQRGTNIYPEDTANTSPRENVQTAVSPESTPRVPENNTPLPSQYIAGVEVRHTATGPELHPAPGYRFPGEVDTGDFSPRELRLLERGLNDGGYQTVTSFDPNLPYPFGGTHLIQLKNGQYALEKVSWGTTTADAQTLGNNSMKSIMKAFGMPGQAEHFGPTTLASNNAYESHAYIPLSDEQAKFIRENYAKLGRALTNASR